MIGLVLLACHLLGDFVLQSRGQAEGKLKQRGLRVGHVLTYLIPFVPVALLLGWPWRGLEFLAALGVLHYLTDSRRFLSTVGDWIAWRATPPVAFSTADPLVYQDGDRIKVSGQTEEGPREWTGRVVGRLEDALLVKMGLTANPWPPAPILIDQALHVAQLAVLGWLLV